MAILDVLRPRKAAPAVLVVSASEVSKKTGELWRELALGAVIRVDDVKSRRTVGWITSGPPESVQCILDHLPAPGEASDRLPTGDAE